MSNQKIENNSSEAPLPTPSETGETEELINNIYTICPDCGSSIEILSINDNSSIEYRCLNEKKKHTEDTQFTKTIEEYLKKVKEIEDNNFDEIKDKCHIENHNLNKYVSYCLDCRCHLCNECLKTKEHINHRKSNMIEIQPIEEEKELIKEVINDLKEKKKNLENSKKKETEKIDESLKKEQKEEKDIYENKIKDNKKEEEEELKENENKYSSDIENIKREYEEKLRIRKDQYLKDNEKIKGKYKLNREKFQAELNLKISKLKENCKLTKQNLGFTDKIKNNENMLKLNEIIYNTYDNFCNNYYNSMSINNLILYYSNNTEFNNKMKNKLGNKYEKIINIRKKKFDEEKQIKLEDELNKTKEKNEELEKKNEELESRIKNIKEENKKLEKEKMDEINEKYQKVNEMNEKFIKENKELSEMKENLIKKINDYETQINKYKLDIKNMEDKNNELDEELNKTKEEFEKLKSDKGQQQNVSLF